MWQEMKDRTLVEIAKVDSLLNAISQDLGCERYKDILFMWYVEKKPKEYIANEVGYSQRQSVYEIKNKAIKKFAVALFGIVALVAI
jgi:DNA-directed RNA polymerase specialized sigma subunit